MLFKIAALVLPLGLDTFAVAAAIGAIGLEPSERHRVTLLFTAFETVMPLVGVALGAPLGRAIGAAADYLAVGVLIGFGILTLLRHEDDEQARLERLRRTRGPGAIVLGTSISLDELAIGFTLGLLHVPVAAVIVWIAVQTMIVTQLGLRLGTRLSRGFHEGAERLAGVALIVLGAVLLAEQLF